MVESIVTLASAFFSGAIVGAAALLGRWLVAAATRDVAQRIALTVWGIRVADQCTSWLLGHRRLSGNWKIEWDVESNLFEQTNLIEGRLYRVFNQVALQEEQALTTGQRIPLCLRRSTERGP